MRTLIKSLITLWVTLSVSMGSYGLYGNEMYEHCAPDAAPIQGTSCLAFIRGATDMHELQSTYLGGTRLYCLEEGNTYDQLRKVVFKYMDENPEFLHESFLFQVANSLGLAFPCEEE